TGSDFGPRIPGLPRRHTRWRVRRRRPLRPSHVDPAQQAVPPTDVDHAAEEERTGLRRRLTGQPEQRITDLLRLPAERVDLPGWSRLPDHGRLVEMRDAGQHQDDADADAG